MPSRRATIVDTVARVVAVGYLVALLAAVVVYKGAFLDALTVSPVDRRRSSSRSSGRPEI